MLHLAAPTRDTWLEQARADLPTLLVDHAHCEKKAASTAIGMLFKFPDLPHLQKPLSELAREELEHFELVIDLLRARGLTYDRLEAAPYAARLHKHVRKAPNAFLDLMLCCALIEARSCERMRILSEGLSDDDPELAEFYGSLLASEARHHMLYVNLAREVVPEDDVWARLQVLAAAEAEALSDPGPHLRMHS